MKNAKILFVDDDLYIQELYLKILKDHKVYQATTGQQAIDIYLENKDFDIIILDMTLGIGLNGYDVFEKIYDVDPKIKVIICTGYSYGIKSVNDQIHKLSTDYNCKILTKPINNKELLSIIDELPLF